MIYIHQFKSNPNNVKDPSKNTNYVRAGMDCGLANFVVFR